MMLEVPERSLGSFRHNGCSKQTPRKLHIKFLISTHLGSGPSPMCLQSVIMESKRTLVVPERSLCGSGHVGYPKDTSRKLHINFQISTFLGSAQSSMCLQSIIMESKRMLVVPERSLGSFCHGGCHKDIPRKLHINFRISTLLGVPVVSIFAKCESVSQ
jgi:hypothetical protein